MAERAFVEKLHRAGLVGVTVVDRRPWGIDDCARYPLFDDELIKMMRRLVPAERHGEVAAVTTVVARKP